MPLAFHAHVSVGFLDAFFYLRDSLIQVIESIVFKTLLIPTYKIVPLQPYHFVYHPQLVKPHHGWYNSTRKIRKSCI